jgi:hypothetical protein
MELTVHCDLTGLVKWDKATRASIQGATNMAGSSALRAMRAEGSRRIREKKGIQARQIDSALTMIFPTNKPIWTLLAKSKPLPLIAFGARQTMTGVSVEVTKGKRAIIRSAFIATMQSGHKGVFQRRGTKQIMGKGRYAGKLRQPIYELFTASVSSALAQAAPRVLERGESVFRATFLRMMKRAA